jgi:hypothetical protein
VVEDRTTQALRAHWRAVNETHDRTVAHHKQVLAQIASNKALEASAERELQTALEAGQDAGRIAKANAALASAAASLTMLEAQRAAAEQAVTDSQSVVERTQSQYEAIRQTREEQAKQAKTEPKPAAEEPEAKRLTVDQWIDQHPRKLASWLREHKELCTDEAKRAELMQFGAEYAQDYGQAAVHTPQFIEAMAAKFAPKTEDDEVDDENNEPPVEEKPEPRRSAPAAPVSRGNSPTRPSGSGDKIKLTPEQHAIAPTIIDSFEDLDPDFKERFKVWSPTAARFQYERNLKKSLSDGKMNKN